MSLKVSTVLNRLSLRTVLTCAFIFQVVAAVGVVGYLSFRNTQTAVYSLTSQLRNELIERILQQLHATVESPHVINLINADTLLEGDINVSAGVGEQFFWRQARIFTATNLIYCGNEADGAFLAVGKLPGETSSAALGVQVGNATTDYRIQVHALNATGRRTALVAEGQEPYDPRQRPWYVAAKVQQKPTWSPIYLDYDTQEPTITASAPVYHPESGQLLAVCATDIILSKELNGFLRSLKIGGSGTAFIIEPSGSLIATSTQESLIEGEKDDPTTTNSLLLESPHPLIQHTIAYLSETFNGLENVTSSQLEFQTERDRHFLEVVRYRDDYGLDWIVVVVIPENDFIAQISQNNRTTLVACIFALLVAILLGICVTEWLTRPLSQLTQSARKIAIGEWDQAITLERSDEIGELSRALTSMATQLQESFSLLEKRIQERTQQLQLLARIDPLTNLANRRYFDTYLEQEWKRLAREEKPLTFVLCDIDYFKLYNDTYGHQQGDRCLQEIARLLQDTINRPADLVVRYGGEEFALILPNTDQDGGIYLLEKLQMSLWALDIPHQASPKGRVTCSCGIATVIPHVERDCKALILAADKALYTAKAEGRDRYCIAEDQSSRSSDV